MAVRDFPAGGLTARGQAWLDAGSPDGPTPRVAATVELLRDGTDGLEVFVLERVSTMAFAPSMLVFPGGGVDPRDAEGCFTWGVGAPGRLDLATDADGQATERSVLAAACRELYEECGVLLASPLPEFPTDGRAVALTRPDDPDLPLADPTGWGADRAALVAREITLAGVLLKHHLGLRADLLSPRARWCTPHFEDRRYDTFFFAARAPEGQEPDGETTEAASVRWVRPAQVLDELSRGEVRLLPPTIAAMEDLARFDTVDAALAAAPVVRLVTPSLVDLAAEGSGEGLVIRVVDGAGA